jgi:Zn-finger nucleic acid-binding protein
MKCPNCDTTLAMSERLGVEIDYCPECRGVWLDRGEIDRLLEQERARVEVPAQVGAAPVPPPMPSPAPPHSGYDDRGAHEQRSRTRKWTDLLDFG